MTDERRRSTRGRGLPLVYKLVVGSALQLAALYALLLLPAGTFWWWRGWVLIALLVGMNLVTALFVFARSPELFDERLKAPIQKGQPLGDKIVTVLFITAFVALMIFIPLDVFRFRMIGAPGPIVSGAGLGLVAAGSALIVLALRANAFAAPVVKHQKERRQYTVDTGVYAFVRHPMYTGGILFILGMPLWLQSYAGALLAAVPIALLVVRIPIEERFLRRELEGYDAYTKKVRRRLIPSLW